MAEWHFRAEKEKLEKAGRQGQKDLEAERQAAAAMKAASAAKDARIAGLELQVRPVLQGGGDDRQSNSNGNI
jgi:hypothetical protein